MSGIRSPSGVPSGVTGSTKSPASGQGPVNAASPSTPTGGEGGGPARNPQPATTALSETTLVNAVVTAKSSSENIILHTEFGNFRITTSTPLTVGSHITFEVMEAEEIILARVLNVNGKALSPPLDVRLLPTVERVISGAEGYIKAGQLHPLELKPSLQMLAPSLPVAKSNALPPPALSPTSYSTATERPATGHTGTAPTGNAATILSDNIPRANPQGFAVYQRYHSPSVLISNSSISGAVFAEPPLMPQNQPSVFVADVLRQRSPAIIETSSGQKAISVGDKVNLIVRSQKNAAALPPHASILQGTVVALTNAPNSGGLSRVTMQTPIGTLSYNTTTPPATGTNVQFALADEISVFPLPGSNAQQPGELMPKLSVMGDWQNLRDAVNHIARQDPIVAQTVISQIIPQANSQLSNSLLFFMAALNLGSIEKWLGQEFIQAMKAAGRAPLLQALEDDFATFSRLQSDTGGQDWKSLNFPFFDGTNLRQIRMFHRRHKNPDDAVGDTETTRFVIELNLTKSGHLQLDGLFKNRLFDLAVRSHKDISEAMRQHIGKLFNEHMEISGLKGQLIFKTIAPFPINPLKEWEGGAEAAMDSKFPG